MPSVHGKQTSHQASVFNSGNEEAFGNHKAVRREHSVFIRVPKFQFLHQMFGQMPRRGQAKRDETPYIEEKHLLAGSWRHPQTVFKTGSR